MLRHLLNRAFATSIVLLSTAGCGVPPMGDEVGSLSQALCPAPSTPVSFAATTTIDSTTSSSYFQPAAATSADFNGDGNPDVVIIDSWQGRNGGNQVRFYAGTADGWGGGRPAAVVSEIVVNRNFYNPQRVTSADFDGDGVRDIAWVDQNGSALLVGHNDGMGHFSNGGWVQLTGLVTTRGLAAADFDNDGRTDLVVVGATSANFTFVRNAGGNAFVQQAPVAAPYGGLGDVIAADLDADGNADLVIAVTGAGSGSAQPFFLYRGAGNGAFALGGAARPRNQGINGPSSYGPAFVDLDADGRLDLAYVESATRAVHVFRNASAGAGPAFADETATAGSPFALPDAVSTPSMVAADFDGDGLQDLGVLGRVNVGGARFDVFVQNPAGGPAFLAGRSVNVDVPGGGSVQPSTLAVAAPFNRASCGVLADLVYGGYDGSGKQAVYYTRNMTF